jgi:hypothetical protein
MERGVISGPLKSIVKKKFGRVYLKPLKYIKGLFEWGVKKG